MGRSGTLHSVARLIPRAPVGRHLRCTSQVAKSSAMQVAVAPPDPPGGHVLAVHGSFVLVRNLALVSPARTQRWLIQGTRRTPLRDDAGRLASAVLAKRPAAVAEWPSFISWAAPRMTWRNQRVLGQLGVQAVTSSRSFNDAVAMVGRHGEKANGRLGLHAARGPDGDGMCSRCGLPRQRVVQHRRHPP